MDKENIKSWCDTYFIKYGVDLFNLFVLFIIAFVLPDQIFDGKVDPTDFNIPGSSTTIVWKNVLNSTDKFNSTVFYENPQHTRSYVENTAVSGTMLGVYDGLVPSIYILAFIWGYFYKYLKWNGKYLYYDTVSYFYAYLISMGMVFWLTRILKILCGWNRPDFWDRCNPIYSRQETDTSSTMIFVECDYENFHHYDDYADYLSAFASFPSGHTSYMFAAAIVLTYFTYGKLNHPDYTTEQLFSFKCDQDSSIGKLAGAKWTPAKLPNGEENKHRIYFYVFDVSLIVGFVLATWGCWASVWVAISRIDDHRHFPADLLGGGLLGFACATFGFLSQYDYGQAFSKRVLRIMEQDYIIESEKRRRVLSESNQNNNDSSQLIHVTDE